jgi:hypothetical protein
MKKKKDLSLVGLIAWMVFCILLLMAAHAYHNSVYHNKNNTESVK